MRKPSSSRPSKRDVQKALSRCAFSPNVPGPISAVVKDRGAEYLLQRAQEFLDEGLVLLKNKQPLSAKCRIDFAVAILAYANCVVSDGPEAH